MENRKVIVTLTEGFLELRDLDNNARWVGKPLGVDVVKAEVLPESTEVIVLLDRDEYPSKSLIKKNLIKVDLNGNLIWEADIPWEGMSDSWVDFEIDKFLTGTTFGGWKYQLSVEGGVVLGGIFVK